MLSTKYGDKVKPLCTSSPNCEQAVGLSLDKKANVKFAEFFTFKVLAGEIMHNRRYISYNAEIIIVVDFPALVAQDNRASLYFLQNGAGYISHNVFSQIGKMISEYIVPKKYGSCIKVCISTGYSLYKDLPTISYITKDLSTSVN